MWTSARSSCPDFLTHTKHRPASSEFQRTGVSCSAIGVRESTCALNGQQAPLHNRKPRPPLQQLSIKIKRCALKTQHVIQHPPDLVNFTVETIDDSVDLVNEPLDDMRCSSLFSQVLREVSCSNDLLCKAESIRIHAHPPKDRRASICRSPLRRLLAKAGSVPENITASSLDENPPSPVIRYLPGCGLTTIRRMQAVRLRGTCNQSRRSACARHPLVPYSLDLWRANRSIEDPSRRKDCEI